MWISCLLINVGDNTDRPPGRLWLRNLYHVHQRLCMAFPSASRKSNDPLFLHPFKPDEFADGHVRVRRGENSGFLYRIDSLPGGCVVILVQSAAKPNWEYAFQNARFLLAAPPHVKPFDAHFTAGQQLAFRIRVNLSKKLKRAANGADLQKKGESMDRWGRPKAQSKRVALTWEKGQNPEGVIRKWFAAKAGDSFDLETLRVIQIGWGTGYQPKREAESQGRLKFRSALLEGTLAVKNEETFREIIVCGIGSAKAFGFGLLSVAPVCTDDDDRRS